MTQRNIIKGSAVHLANLSTRLKPTTFFVKHTSESGRDLPEARDLCDIPFLQCAGARRGVGGLWPGFGTPWVDLDAKGARKHHQTVFCGSKLRIKSTSRFSADQKSPLQNRHPIWRRFYSNVNTMKQTLDIVQDFRSVSP